MRSEIGGQGFAVDVRWCLDDFGACRDGIVNQRTDDLAAVLAVQRRELGEDRFGDDQLALAGRCKNFRLLQDGICIKQVVNGAGHLEGWERFCGCFTVRRPDF